MATNRRVGSLLVLLLATTAIHGFQPPATLSTASRATTRGVAVPEPLSMIKKSKKSSSKGSKKSLSQSSGAGFGGAAPPQSSSGPILKDAPSWASRFPFAGDLRPGGQSPQRVVIADNVVPPDYADDGSPKNARPMLPWVIEVKTPDQIEKMRDSGRLARHVLDTAGRAVKAGVTTEEIDQLVHEETLKVRSG